MSTTNTYTSSQSGDATRQQELSSAEALLGEPEPWESWETKLVTYSIGIAIIGLVVLGYLINTYILS